MEKTTPQEQSEPKLSIYEAFDGWQNHCREIKARTNTVVEAKAPDIHEGDLVIFDKQPWLVHAINGDQADLLDPMDRNNCASGVKLELLQKEELKKPITNKVPPTAPANFNKQPQLEASFLEPVTAREQIIANSGLNNGYQFLEFSEYEEKGIDLINPRTPRVALEVDQIIKSLRTKPMWAKLFN